MMKFQISYVYEEISLVKSMIENQTINAQGATESKQNIALEESTISYRS